MKSRRTIRNQMQHANASITVNNQHCADAIIDAVNVVDKCWNRTSKSQFNDWVKCGLRIIKLYSSNSNPAKISLFETEMLKINWRGSGSVSVRTSEKKIQLGNKPYWYIAVVHHTPLVESCLNLIGAK